MGYSKARVDYNLISRGLSTSSKKSSNANHECKSGAVVGDPLKKKIITTPGCALVGRTILCFYALDYKDKVLYMLNFCQNDQKKTEQKKNKGRVPIAESSAYNSQNTQFGKKMI